MNKNIQLRDIKKGSKIKVELKNGKDAFVIFDHLDGMYSYCYLESDHSKLLHLSFATPLKKEKDYYIIKGGKDENSSM